jgi:hypothetical protein
MTIEQIKIRELAYALDQLCKGHAVMEKAEAYDLAEPLQDIIHELKTLITCKIMEGSLSNDNG